MRVLVLARHAKAEASSPDKTDHARVLIDRGRNDATALGAALTAAGFEPDVAYISDSARTVQTWELTSAGWEVPEVHIRADLYATTVETLLSVVQGTSLVSPGASNVIVVGHEPTLSSAAAYLSGDGSNREALQRVAHGIPTGSAAVVEFDGEWADLARGTARLKAVILRVD
jgi:phosphohistidine phosphatase